MFWKTKTEIENSVDKEVRRLNFRIWETDKDLREQTQRVIISLGVASLYPDGADKQEAIRKAEKEKDMLILAISRYDRSRRDYLNYLKQHGEERIATAQYHGNILTSHEVIEHEYKRFYKHK